MAIAYSSILQNLDANPRVVTDAANLGGKLRIAAATIEAGTGDIDASDVIMLFDIPSNAKLHSLVLFNDDLDSNVSPTLAAHIGLYAGAKFTDTDSSFTVYQKDDVIDADCYATAITALQDANTEGSEFAYEVRDIADIAQDLWEDCSLTSDPKIPLRLALTISNAAATAAAGTITVRCIYSVV